MTNRNNTQTIPGIWAQTADTDLSNPQQGTTYRDATLDSTVMENGQQFATKVDFSVLNQLFYLSTFLLKQLESQGILSWRPTQPYEMGAIVMGSNGFLYRCVVASSTGNDPISTGQWMKLDFADKANISLNNISTSVCAADGLVKTSPDVVVEYKISSNGKNWYRKYKSGWLEQGGVTDDLQQTVIFPKPFTNINYCFNALPYLHNPEDRTYYGYSDKQLTQITFTFRRDRHWTTPPVMWTASGF